MGETLNIKNKEYDLLLNRDLNRDINYEFASSLFYQRTLYNQLEKDAVNLTSKNKISSLLKNTDLIIFNIGNYELQRLINYDVYSLYYDEQTLNNGKELFEYYLYHSLDILSDYCRNIVVIPMYCSVILDDSNKAIYLKLVNAFNEIIMSLCRDFSLYYVNIDKLSRFVYKDNCISESGYDYLLRQMKEAYDFS